MNILAWIMALSLMVVIVVEAITFHKATICRQEAWLRSTELKTRTLLHGPDPSETSLILRCRIKVVRKDKEVSWQQFPSSKSHDFELHLEGKL